MEEKSLYSLKRLSLGLELNTIYLKLAEIFRKKFFNFFYANFEHSMFLILLKKCYLLFYIATTFCTLFTIIILVVIFVSVLPINLHFWHRHYCFAFVNVLKIYITIVIIFIHPIVNIWSTGEFFATKLCIVFNRYTVLHWLFKYLTVVIILPLNK